MTRTAEAPQRPEARTPARTDSRVFPPRKVRTSHDRFAIDPSRIPDGMSLNWKRFANIGQEDRLNQQIVAEGGWLPVDPKHYPGIATEYDGMQLCERPIEYTLAAQAEDEAAARNAVRNNNRALAIVPEGETLRGSVTTSFEPVTTSFEPGIPVPD